MHRLLFEKKGNGIYISHLDLMRLFQRAFQRAGLRLTHTHGYNPRPSVSIALPLSVGVESKCELLDFELDGQEVSCDQIRDRLNGALIPGVHVREVYENGSKLKNLVFLESSLRLEYDRGVPENAVAAIKALFSKEEIIVPKKTKNGIQDQDLAPMIRKLHVERTDDGTVVVRLLGCCQNPSLNPLQLHCAIVRYLPDLVPDFVYCSREELYDGEEHIFR